MAATPPVSLLLLIHSPLEWLWGWGGGRAYMPQVLLGQPASLSCTC